MKKLLLIPFLFAAATMIMHGHCGSCDTGKADVEEQASTCAEGCKKACCGKKAQCDEKEKKACLKGCAKACCETDKSAPAKIDVPMPKMACCPA